MQRTSVSQFRKARFPERMSVAWSAAVTVPATWRSRRGPSRNHGTTSSTPWFTSAPRACTPGGRWWIQGESGFGIGWVS